MSVGGTSRQPTLWKGFWRRPLGLDEVDNGHGVLVFEVSVGLRKGTEEPVHSFQDGEFVIVAFRSDVFDLGIEQVVAAAEDEAKHGGPK